MLTADIIEGLDLTVFGLIREIFFQVRFGKIKSLRHSKTFADMRGITAFETNKIITPFDDRHITC